MPKFHLGVTDSSGEKWAYFECPGCDGPHGVVIGGSARAWGFNGDSERPTLTPSVHVSWTQGPEHTPHVCHSFVRDGQIQFLADCTHALAGQTVPIPEWDTW